MNLSDQALPFEIYFVSDGYSTAKKIMGRQSAGKAIIKGIARTRPANLGLCIQAKLMPISMPHSKT